MTAASATSDYRDLVRDIEDNGFTFVRRSKHQILYADKTGTVVGVPTSPSDWRSLANARADLRRAIRARTEGPDPMPTMPIVSALSVATQAPAAPELVTCKKCGELKPAVDYRISPLTGTRVHTCRSCAGRAAAATRALKRASKPSGPSPRAKPVEAPPAAAPPSKTSDLTPEVMATRLLVQRHRAEFDLLLIEMMTALGWGQ